MAERKMKRGSKHDKSTPKKKEKRKDNGITNAETAYWQSEAILLNAMEDLGYDGNLFIQNVKESVEVRKWQSKEPEQIRYLHYLTWALSLRKKDIGSLIDGEQPKYSFPAVVLAFIRSLVPENVKGELWPEAYKVSLEEFCFGIELPKK